MDKEFNKLYNMAIVFVVAAAIIAAGAFLVVTYKILEPAAVSVLLAGLSLMISSGSFMFLVINTQRQIIANEKSK